MSVSLYGSGQTVVQVVQTVKTSVFTTTTTLPSFSDITGASATITPLSTSNKILVTVTGYIGNNSSAYTSAINLVRNSTSIAIGDARGSTTQCMGGSPFPTQYTSLPFTVSYLDSPSTTSATTYKLQLGAESGSTASVGGSYNSSYATTFSTPTIITLQEIAYV